MADPLSSSAASNVVIDDQTRSARIAAVDQRKDLELARLDAVDAVTIQDKIRLEQTKTAIEAFRIR